MAQEEKFVVGRLLCVLRLIFLVWEAQGHSQPRPEAVVLRAGGVSGSWGPGRCVPDPRANPPSPALASLTQPQTAGFWEGRFILWF